MYLYLPLFKKHGKNFIFDPNDHFSYSTMKVGDDVFIGHNAIFSATESGITIGNKVMFGPNVTIMGGDHNTSLLGEYMFDINDKRPHDDLEVTIKDDVWVGTGVIILKGVTIGTGSIIAAGSLVNKDIEDYSIYAGVPARFIKKRFEEDDLIIHKKLLGSKND